MKVSIPNQEYEVNPEDVTAVQNLINFLVPEQVKQLAGMLTDTIKGWRAENMVKVMVKTKKLIRDSGLSENELNGKFFVQAIEKASVEDDELIQDKWAIMLANAHLGKIEQDVKYINILSELSLNEVKLLDLLYSLELKTPDLAFSTEKVAQNFGLNIQTVKVMIDNLYRLNICQPPAASGISIGPEKMMLRTNNSFTFTDLGKEFLLNCTRKF